METYTLFKIYSLFFCLGMAILVYRRQFSEGYNIIRKWAERGGYRLVRCELRSFRRGPFTLKDAKYRNVYYVIVEDKHGKQKSGFICCGGSENGVNPERMEFRWEHTGR